MQLISFSVEGDFAAFRDPSVTANQTVSLIPPKSAIIGMIGAIIGLRRSHSIFTDIYSKEYVNLLEATCVGVKVTKTPLKQTFYTNHRSLKEPKTKPFKTELLLSPGYIFYVATSENIQTELLKRIEEYNFVFSPTLGHAYCPAKISNIKCLNATEIEPENIKVSTVILDEVMEVNTLNSGVNINLDIYQEVAIERLLYHYVRHNTLQRVVLRHLIPLPTDNGPSYIKVKEAYRPLSVSRYYAIDGSDETLCLY
ncbi:MAG: CRISPR-associated protein Cas5 [Candidatus Bathyarchaeia archaeon]